MKKTALSTIKREPKRGVYNQDEIYKILDKESLCHIGFVYKGNPVVIPTIYGRKQNKIYIHGASISRLITELEVGIKICVSIANISGLVLARSAFHHSLNYESVVLFGSGKLVDEDNKVEALKIISDHSIKGRWEEVRPPNQKELKATKVIEIEIEEMSAKVRRGDSIDDKQDFNLDVWSGVLPINKNYGIPKPNSDLKKDVHLSKSIVRLIKQ